MRGLLLARNATDGDGVRAVGTGSVDGTMRGVSRLATAPEGRSDAVPYQADAVGCHIITAKNDVLAKLALVGKELDEYSLETVKMFRQDALGAGYSIAVRDLAVRAG